MFLLHATNDGIKGGGAPIELPQQNARDLTALGVPQLDHYLGLLSGQLDADGTRALFSSIITIPPSTLGPLLSAVLAACVQKVREGGEFTVEYKTALELGERYPGDPGVLASLLLNRITLQPGQALYLARNNMLGADPPKAFGTHSPGLRE